MRDRWVGYILRGLTVVIPIGVTIWALRTIFLALDNWLLPADAEGRERIPGIGVLIIVGIATLVGFLADAKLTRRYVAGLEHFLGRIPVVKLIYGALKDFVDAFLGKHKRFDKPVLVSLGGGFDCQVIGFITREDLSGFGVQDKVAVYFPQSYNIGGNLLILPRDRLTLLDADSSAVMAFLVSGGVAHLPGSVLECDPTQAFRGGPPAVHNVPGGPATGLRPGPATHA
jgi:uncharacterized membrane protein